MKQVFLTIVLIESICFMLTSCSISFQNISTHGTATDLVDQTQKNDAETDIKTSLK